MDFVTIENSYVKSRDAMVIKPTFVVGNQIDNLLVKGKSFYGIWNEKTGKWSTDEYDVVDYVDSLIDKKAEEIKPMTSAKIEKDYLKMFNNGGWEKYKKYCQLIPSTSVQLDSDITFLNQKTTKED